MNSKTFVVVGLMMTCLGMGLWLGKQHSDPVQSSAILSVVPPLDSVEQHIADIIGTAAAKPIPQAELKPWIAAMMSGESLVLLPAPDTVDHGWFNICYSTKLANCSRNYVTRYGTQLGGTLKAGVPLTITLDSETNTIYVSDRVGFAFSNKAE